MLIGRDHERTAIGDALDAGRAVVLVGEAGVGKTSLAREALAGRRVVAAQCFRSLAWSAGLPLQQACGRSVPAGDATWTARWLAAHLPDGAVLAVEDLQWADPLTMQVVPLLASRAVSPTAARVAPRAGGVVATVRSGDAGTAAALEAMVGAGAVRVDLEPLDETSATELAARRHPLLGPAGAAALARRCGGNPLLIEETGRDGAASPTLVRALARRVRALGPQARASFGWLVVAQQPLPRGFLDGVDELVATGLVTIVPASGPGDGADVVQPRHPLICEVAAADPQLFAGSGDAARADAAALAARAERVEWWALAARAHAAAGCAPAALECATRAAARTQRPGERAALLRLAAGHAGPDHAHELAVRAVAELVEAGDYAQAAELIADLDADADADAGTGTDTDAGTGDTAGARWWTLVGRVRWQTGDDDGAIAAFGTALADAGATARDRVTAQCEHARAVALGLGDLPRALDLAHAAHAAARDADVELARALCVLGTVESLADRPDSVAHLTEAIELAAADGDVLVEMTSMNNLASTLESSGRGVEACRLAERAAARAGDLRLGAWELQLRAMALNARLHLGEYEQILDDAPRLLAASTDRRTTDQLEVTLGIALTDVGRGHEAIARVHGALERGADDPQGRGNLLWVLAEAQLWSGDPPAAAVTANEAIDATSESLRLFPLLSAWQAQVWGGAGVARRATDGTGAVPEHLPLLDGAPVELAALAAQADGDRAGARASFVEAAAAWAGFHRRGELRCRWAAADVDADDTRASRELLVLEAELEALGWAPLLGRVRRSLRARGIRRSAPRGRAGSVTDREREVLDLVSQGLSTNEIAARLSLAPATVASLITSARSRLGAGSRWLAASSD